MISLIYFICRTCCQLEAANFQGEVAHFPQRVLEESVVNPESLCSLLESVVSGLRTNEEKAAAVSRWMSSGAAVGEKSKMKLGATEDRPKSALQLIEHREGACREFNLCFVSCMRALVIPARHGMASWWYVRPKRHFCAEYWDTEQGCWVGEEPLNNTPAAKRAGNIENGVWNSLAWYSMDFYPEEVGLEG